MSKDAGSEVQIDRMTEMHCAQCGTRLDISALEPFSSVGCPSCGNQDTVPARFGQFLLLNLINVGGMGAVYRGRDESLGRLVAVKVMLKKLGEDLEFVETFKREAQAAAQLNHPNVAQIYSYGQVQGQPYIVMELVSGHRFDRLIESHPEGLDPAMVLRIGIDIAEGLQAADEIGLVHGDIKPENILLDEKRKAKLVDFGIASFLDQAASEGIWGTPYYIAPEKAQGRKSDSRSDIFSLGATLYHALAGKPPFDGETPIDVVKARLLRSAPILDEVRPEVSKTLAGTVGRMLEREPARRHPTYASLLGDLRRNLQETGAAPRAGVTGKRVILKKKELAPGGPQQSGRLVFNRSGATVNQLPRLEEQREAMRLRQRRKAKIFGVVTAVVVLVVGVGVLVARRHTHAQREQELRRQALALDQAKVEVGRAYAAVVTAAGSVNKLAEQFEPLAASVQPALRDALALVPPPPREAATVGAPAETPAAAEPAAPPESPPEPATEVAPVDAEGREAPIGMPDRESFERNRQRHSGETPAAVSPPPVSVPATPSQAMPAVAAQVGATTTVVTPTGPAGQIQALAAKFEQWVAHAQDATGKVSQIMRTAGVVHTSVADVEVLEEIAPKATLLRESQAQIDGLASGLRARLTEAQGAVQQVTVLTRDLRRQAEELRVADDLRRAGEERQEQVEEELEIVRAAQAEGNARIRQGEYDAALRELTAAGRRLRTDGGKAALAVAKDRYARLVALKKYLIEQLNLEPFGWGWVRPGGTREDVLGADARGVKLRGREVPWSRVSNAQFLAFVEHYAGRPQTRPSVKGEQFLAAAIYCAEFGNADYANRYRTKAVEASPQLSAEADRLLMAE